MGVFCKKVENGGCFLKVKNGGCFVKKVENGGCYFVKKGTFPQRRVHNIQYRYFLFYILLIWGVGTHPTHPLPTGLRQHN